VYVSNKMEASKEVMVIHTTPKERTEKQEHIICEIPFTIVVNGRELATLQCSPTSLEYLAVGFLLSEGVLTRREDVKRTILDDRGSHIRIDVVANVKMETLVPRRLIGSAGVSFCRRRDAEAMSRVNSQLRVSTDKLLWLMQQFQTKSALYSLTRGNHSCALYNADGTIKVFADDIGRCNAIDKVIGECLMKGISEEDKILATSGRISAEIVNEVAKRKIPVIISFGAPTNLALDLAKSVGLTVIGSVREQNLSIFTNDQRVV
jgi:FdhD protein